MKSSPPGELVEALHRFGLERARLRTALARQLGVPVADLDALEHLELSGPLSQRDLAERLLLSSGAVTFLVDRLVDAGLVTRQPHPSDRRATLVTLKPGAELPQVPELDAYHAALHRAAVQLPPAGRATVTGFLSTITTEAATATRQLHDGTPARPRGTRPSSREPARSHTRPI